MPRALQHAWTKLCGRRPNLVHNVSISLPVLFSVSLLKAQHNNTLRFSFLLWKDPDGICHVSFVCRGGWVVSFACFVLCVFVWHT